MQGLGNNDLIITLQPPPNLHRQESGVTEEEKEEDQERQEEEEQQEEEEFVIALFKQWYGKEADRKEHAQQVTEHYVQLWPSLWMQVTLHCTGIITKHCCLTACSSGSLLCCKSTTFTKARTG